MELQLSAECLAVRGLVLCFEGIGYTLIVCISVCVCVCVHIYKLLEALCRTLVRKEGWFHFRLPVLLSESVTFYHFSLGLACLTASPQKIFYCSAFGCRRCL